MILDHGDEDADELGIKLSSNIGIKHLHDFFMAKGFTGGSIRTYGIVRIRNTDNSGD